MEQTSSGKGNLRRTTCAGYYGDRIQQPQAIAESRDPNILETGARQPRQQVRVDLVVPELLVVFAEPKTAKPPADIHRRASLAWEDDRSGAPACPAAPIGTAWR
jgi:hypothetical protein